MKKNYWMIMCPICLRSCERTKILSPKLSIKKNYGCLFKHCINNEIFEFGFGVLINS